MYAAPLQYLLTLYQMIATRIDKHNWYNNNETVNLTEKSLYGELTETYLTI